MSDEIRAEIKAAAKALCHYPSGPHVANSCCPGIGRCEMEAAIAEITRLRAACDASEERERAIELRFWQTVDRDGLTGLPSDMWAALEQLVRDRAAIATARRDARVQQAKRDALEEAARLARHYATIIPMHGSLKCDIYEAAGQAATEIAASIEALAEKELLSEEIIRADRDAWPDYQANDPVIRALKGEGNE
jgi:hypothetical protein